MEVAIDITEKPSNFRKKIDFNGITKKEIYKHRPDNYYCVKKYF